MSNPKRRKKYNNHDERIKQIVNQYNEIPELDYLKGISYNIKY